MRVSDVLRCCDDVGPARHSSRSARPVETRLAWYCRMAALVVHDPQAPLTHTRLCPARVDILPAQLAGEPVEACTEMPAARVHHGEMAVASGQ